LGDLHQSPGDVPAGRAPLPQQPRRVERELAPLVELRLAQPAPGQVEHRLGVVALERERGLELADRIVEEPLRAAAAALEQRDVRAGGDEARGAVVAVGLEQLVGDRERAVRVAGGEQPLGLHHPGIGLRGARVVGRRSRVRGLCRAGQAQQEEYGRKISDHRGGVVHVATDEDSSPACSGAGPAGVCSPSTVRRQGSSRRGGRPADDTAGSADRPRMADSLEIKVESALDRSNVARLLGELADAVRRRPQRVVVDLGTVERFDSAGLGGVVEGLRRARATGVEVRLRGLSQPMLDFFSLLSVERLTAGADPRARLDPISRVSGAELPGLRGTATTARMGAGLGGVVEGLRRARATGVEVRLRGLSQPMLDFFSLLSVERLTAGADPRARLDPISRVGAAVLPVLRGTAAIARMAVRVVEGVLLAPLRGHGLRVDRCTLELDHAANGALPIVALISFLLGLILAMQAWVQLRVWGAEIYMADMVGVSVLTEIGPLMTAIVLAARPGSSNAAQLGAMVVGEEIDALRQMGVDPIRFLVVPKVLALAFAALALCVVFDVVAIFGGAA